MTFYPILLNMPELVKKEQDPKSSKGKQTKRAFVFSTAEKKLLKRMGLLINKTLTDQDKSVEWLAFKVGLARSTIREILAGRSNPRVLTLNSIAKGLGFRSLQDFLDKS